MENENNSKIEKIENEIKIKLLQIKEGNYTGDRSYQTYSADFEPVDKIIDSFLNINAGTYFTLPIFNESIRLYLIAENILDKNTAFFPDYPEPGLAIKSGMTIKL